MNQLIILMQQPGGEGNPLMSFLPLILIVVVFYFFMIRPQLKRQKEMVKFRNSLKEGDKIITSGGIYGKIVDIKDNIVIIEVEEKMRLRVDKSAVLRDSSDLNEKK
jgi:preprotein translocase subunit YajC